MIPNKLLVIKSCVNNCLCSLRVCLERMMTEVFVLIFVVIFNLMFVVIVEWAHSTTMFMSIVDLAHTNRGSQ